MLSRVAVVIFSIVVCLLPVLLPHLILLPMSALRLWDILTGTSGDSAKRQADGFVGKEAKMTEIRIDAGKAERIITQMLRDEQGMHPADAVALATSICRRLATAMPTNPSLGCCRIISKEPPDADDFAIAWQKSSTGRVSVGTRANFGSLSTIKVAIFG